MTYTKINELEDGKEVIILGMVRDFEIATTKDSKNYIRFNLVSKEGSILVNFWDYSELFESYLKFDGVVQIWGKTNTYKEKIQLKGTLVKPREDLDKKDFLVSAPIYPKIMMGIILEKIETLNNQIIRDLVKYCVGKYEDKLINAPAAKSMHHAYYGGLLYHMMGMLERGEFECRIRPQLNRNLLIGGIILHDLAKTEEMIHKDGIVSEYSVKGNLLGHISMIYEDIHEFSIVNSCRDSEEIMLMKHMVLSHHGELEWGSPVNPKIPEAVALHHIDNLDAKVQISLDEVEKIKEDGTFGTKVFPLWNNPVYKSGLK